MLKLNFYSCDLEIVTDAFIAFQLYYLQPLKVVEIMAPTSLYWLAIFLIVAF